MESIHTTIQWFKDMCERKLKDPPPITLNLKYGYGADEDDNDTVIDEDTDSVLVERLTEGLWIVPVNAPSRLDDYWTMFRYTFPEQQRSGIAYLLIERRDAALEMATETAINAQCVMMPALKRRFLHLALEARMELRRRELVLLNFQVHTGLLGIRSRCVGELFLACSALHRIRVFVYDLLEKDLVKRGFGKNVKKAKKDHPTAMKRVMLLNAKPARTMGFDDLAMNLPYQLDLVATYFQTLMDHMIQDDRYVIRFEELSVLTRLCDMAVKSSPLFVVVVVVFDEEEATVSTIRIPTGSDGVGVVVVVVVMLWVHVDTTVGAEQVADWVEVIVIACVKINVLNLVVVAVAVAVAVSVEVRLGAQNVNATHSRLRGNVTAGRRAVLVFVVAFWPTAAPAESTRAEMRKRRHCMVVVSIV
ncbi:hypothetical protein SpCBS45565_g08402 [Spizellomyces sp. 'palustris']|nr:hypothetical protein SpCBS45565_g08402 [Spizellomyces sp. 'palustris']